jgi:hypothetical protein
MDALAILQYGQATILNSIDGLQDYETGGVCGVWSVKDILAHLASYEHMLVDVFNSLLGDAPTPTLAQMLQHGDAFNDLWVAQYRDKSWDEVLDDFKTTFQQALDLAAKIPPETWAKCGTLAWYGDAYALDDFIVYSFYGHKREHSAQIAVFRDGLKG